MQLVDLFQAAEKLGDKHTRMIEGHDFDIMVGQPGGRPHVCGADEFFCVLKGEGEIMVEGKTHKLTEGQGILVKAGEKHRVQTQNRFWMLITKHPHSHKYFQDEDA